MAHLRKNLRAALNVVRELLPPDERDTITVSRRTRHYMVHIGSRGVKAPLPVDQGDWRVLRNWRAQMRSLLNTGA